MEDEVSLDHLNEMKYEKFLMRLIPRCPKLRGAANPNHARYHCPFAFLIRRSSMPGHIGFRMEKAWSKYKVFIFFRNDCEDFDFLISRGIQFQSWGPQPKKPFHPS